MRLCIPILAATTKEAIRKMNRPFRYTGISDLILELRLDWIRDPDMEMLLAHRQRRVLVTNRRREEGGAFSGKEEERVKMLRDAAAMGADFVDIEVSTNRRLIAGLKKAIGSNGESRTKLVVSWHDYRSTPSERLLREKLARCMEWTPDIVKIVTMARSIEDNLNILRLIPHARRKGVEIVAFSMGDAGRISRVVSPLLGGYLGFAAANGHEPSAPGQMAAGDMLKVLSLLGY